MAGVRIKDNESIEGAIRRFKKQCEKAGILSELRKRGQVINADQLIYNQVEDEVHAQGNVRIEQQNSEVTGPELRMKLETHEGFMREPVYQMKQPDSHGAAENLEFAGPFMATAREVAQEGYRACMAGDVVRIPGIVNQAMVTWLQYQPRGLVRFFSGMAARTTFGATAGTGGAKQRQQKGD